MMSAHGWITDAEDEDIAVKNTGGVDLAICHHVCCPGEALDGQKCESCGGGGELGVGRRREESAFVQSVEGLSIECGDADTKIGLLEGRIRENSLNAAGDGALCRRRV